MHLPALGSPGRASGFEGGGRKMIWIISETDESDYAETFFTHGLLPIVFGCLSYKRAPEAYCRHIR